MTPDKMPESIAFIFISSKPWYSSLGGTAKSLAAELGKMFPTYYINSPIDRASLLKKEKQPEILQHLKKIREGEKLVHVKDKHYQYFPSVIMESVNWIPGTKLFSKFNYWNNLKLSRELKKLIQNEKLENIVLINDKDIFRGYYLKELLCPSLYVYLDRDYVLGVPYWAKHGMTLEPALIKKSDLVLCNSIPFTNSALRYNPNSHFVGNGCDIGLFNGEKTFPKPEPLINIPGKLIGYAGALVALRLNIPVLEEMAQKLKHCSFVLIGKEDEAFRNSKLHSLPNVYFLGFKPLQELPAYYQHFDLCINVQVKNNVTDGNYPMKIDEYLAMGRPVVATNTAAMDYFSEFVYLAETGEEFIDQITLALANDNATIRQQRMKFAREHSWERFSENVLSLIRKNLGAKGHIPK